MTTEYSAELSRNNIRRAFDRAANSYDTYAVLQREVGNRALSRLGFMQIQPTTVVDLGAGTGHCARHLESDYKRARVVLLDIAPNMLKIARERGKRWFSRAHYVCGDALNIGMKSETVDLVFSSLAFQWCFDLTAVFRECKRILRPGGLLLFSSLGPDTLMELRRAWSEVDELPHVNRFLDMHDVGDALIASGLSAPVMDREYLTLTYQDIFAVMRDLKGIGAHNSLEDRRRGLTGKATLGKVQTAYEQFRRDGLLPATYEIVYGHAWAPTSNTRPQDGSTVATFPFDQIKRRNA
jgi:malonyl-CoA O-methyltransferase